MSSKRQPTNPNIVNFATISNYNLTERLGVHSVTSRAKESTQETSCCHQVIGISELLNVDKMGLLLLGKPKQEVKASRFELSIGHTVVKSQPNHCMPFMATIYRLRRSPVASHRRVPCLLRPKTVTTCIHTHYTSATGNTIPYSSYSDCAQPYRQCTAHRGIFNSEPGALRAIRMLSILL